MVDDGVADLEAALDARFDGRSVAESDELHSLVQSQLALARGRGAWILAPDRPDAWLLAAVDTEGIRRGREVVAAFVGPTVGALASGADRLTDFDQLRAALLAVGYALGTVLHVHDEGELRRAAGLLAVVRRGQPEVERAVEEPISYLLRDFYLALEQQDSDAARTLLERIEATGTLRSENLRFLRVELHAALGHWSDLVQLPWFDTLVQAHRPRRVTDHLLEAIWRTNFDDAEAAIDPDASRARFEQAEAGARYGSLFAGTSLPSGRRARRLMALWCASRGEEARGRALVDAADGAEVAVLEGLLAVGGTPGSGSTVVPPAPPALHADLLSAARDRLDQGDYVAVVEAAESHGDDATLAGLAALAVRAADEADDPELAMRSLGVLTRVAGDQLPPSAGFVRQLDRVRDRAEQRCRSWDEWLGRVALDSPWPQAAEVVRDQAATWDRRPFLDPREADSMAERLQDAALGPNANQITSALAELCRLAGTLAAEPNAALFCHAVLDVLGDEEHPSGLVLEGFLSLAAQLLGAGAGGDRYRQLVGAASRLWGRVAAPQTLDWAIEVADLLTAWPCPTPDVRASFVGDVVGATFGFLGRLRFEQVETLRAITADCGIDIAVPQVEALAIAEQETASVWDRLAGRTVLLYSLLDGADRRFKARLLKLCPTADVRTNNDTGGTDRLRALARNSDFVVVDWHHASHAATIVIDHERPKAQQVLPEGSGVSGMLAALREALIATPLLGAS